MLTRLCNAAICSLTALALAGCLVESNVNADGGATVNVRYRIGKEAKLETERARMTSSAVTIVKESLDDQKYANFELKVDDVTKLPTAKFFEDATITLTDGEKGTKVLTAKVVHAKPTKLPKEALDYFGNDFTVTVTLPGEIVSSNATKTEGKTATWSYPLNDFMGAKETEMTVTYKKAEGEAAEAPAKT